MVIYQKAPVITEISMVEYESEVKKTKKKLFINLTQRTIVSETYGDDKIYDILDINSYKQKGEAISQDLLNVTNEQSSNLELLYENKTDEYLLELASKFQLESRHENVITIMEILHNRGNVIGDYYLGAMYNQGIGVEKNHRKAFNYFNSVIKKEKRNEFQSNDCRIICRAWDNVP